MSQPSESQPEKPVPARSKREQLLAKVAAMVPKRPPLKKKRVKRTPRTRAAE